MFDREVKSKALVNREEFQKYLKQADIVVAYASLGTILDCLKAKKHLIISPRVAELGEHFNDHQVELVERLVREPLVGITVIESFEQLRHTLDLVMKTKVDSHKSDKTLL